MTALPFSAGCHLASLGEKEMSRPTKGTGGLFPLSAQCTLQPWKAAGFSEHLPKSSFFMKGYFTQNLHEPAQPADSLL
jgi:hypothetical protein